MTAFNVQVSQNPYLARSADEVHAVVSISSSRPADVSAGSGAGGKLAEALIVDTSGSMEGEKLRCAIAALETAIHLLHEDAMFCVIAGSDHGKVVVPLSGNGWQQGHGVSGRAQADPRRWNGDVDVAGC